MPSEWRWVLDAAALVVVLSAAVPGRTAGQAHPVSLDDLEHEVRLTEPRISPDGDRLMLVTIRANYEADRYDRSLVMIDLETGERVVFAPERPRILTPRWSPSGDRIAFLDVGEAESLQVHVMPSDGGEAGRLTGGEKGVRFFEWSPDGRSIVFGREDVPEQGDGEERHNRSFDVGRDGFLAEEAPGPVHLWRAPLDGGEPLRLTSGPESVEGLSWSPHGDQLALVVRPTPREESRFFSYLQLLDLDSGDRSDLAPARVRTASFSPTGSLVAFRRERGIDQSPTEVFVTSTSPRGRRVRHLTGEIDRDIESLAWLPDGQRLLVSGPDRTANAAWLKPLEGSSRRLDLGGVMPLSAFTVSDSGRIAFVGAGRGQPAEVFVLDGLDDAPRKITDFHTEVASRRLGAIETISWPGPDGGELTGVLSYPPDFKEGRQYPLVLAIHGGPDLTSTESFDLVRQLFTARGWLLFEPNYRGSNNQGEAFQRAIIEDTAEGPARDIMSGVKALRSRGIVNNSRIAVSGWSYGGFLTAWLAAHYEGWAAAVAGQALTDWVDSYNLSSLTPSDSILLGGSPWVQDHIERYREQSPITYAHQIRTPTLILSTTRDEVVPITSSYKLFRALRDNGVEVSFVAYPSDGHWPEESPVHMRDVWRRWIGWIEEHFTEDDLAENP